MGRKGIGAGDDERWVFNRAAGVYSERPPYPTELVSRLVALSGGEGSRVVDLGAGTGHLALPLAHAGLAVTAVEPARRMLEVLVARAAAEGTLVEAVHAAAEGTGLAAGAFDLALVADALHWIDPEPAGAEIARLLATGGVLAVVTIELERTPFVEEVVAAARAVNPRAFPRRREGARRLEHLFAASGVRRRQREVHEDAPLLDEARLGELLASLSFVGPALGPAALASLTERVRAAAARHGGAVWARRVVLEHGRAQERCRLR